MDSPKVIVSMIMFVWLDGDGGGQHFRNAGGGGWDGRVGNGRGEIVFLGRGR